MRLTGRTRHLQHHQGWRSWKRQIFAWRRVHCTQRLYLGVKLGIYPCLIFIGVGAMTDFGPLIANPKSFLLGAAAQIGIFLTFIGAYALGFSPAEVPLIIEI